MATHKNPLKEMNEVIKRPLKVRQKWKRDKEMEGDKGREDLNREVALNGLMLLAKCILLRKQTPKQGGAEVGTMTPKFHTFNKL